jgi:CubicO group peptidase (beta-lactamase class C family)
LAFGAAAVLVVIGAVFAWAWFSTGRSTIARALIWMEADIGDQHRFPARSIPARRQASSLLGGPEADLRAPAREAYGDGAALDRLLRDTETRAFVVVHRDRVVYERYHGGSGRDELETSFSVAKSFLSTLVGIAIDQGLIADVDEPVTDYLPQLAARDPRFERITLRDLLTMSSGLRYEESSFPWPWGDDTYTYYGVDLRKEALERTEIERAPGREWHYNNYNPLLLGLVLERATGKSVSDYMASELWQPLGAARDTTWNLDSEGSGFEKMESGLNATARDYARLGLLLLHGGSWKGERIVSRGWVRAATAAQIASDYDNPYGYFWWVDGTHPGRFYAFGNYGQYIYVDPVADAVVVRLGSDWGLDNENWLATFRDVTDQLVRTPEPSKAGAP